MEFEQFFLCLAYFGAKALDLQGQLLGFDTSKLIGGLQEAEPQGLEILKS